ncbi:GAF domain-containing protein [Actinoplanes rectilineatus]|uniref:GAF domain-containing protein n=1 Tax=Actinoplanes rectilineatus TaxID=113571 RepID=UPI0009F9EE72|nr:GAF domain-containing protein [Actinoplanes rectilineatus]
MSALHDDQAGPDSVQRTVSTLRARGGTGALCAGLQAVLPAIDGVGLTMFTPHGRVVLAVTGRLIDLIEDLQIALGQGPCFDAFYTRRPVLVSDLDDVPAIADWPDFGARAVAVGIRAVFAFPVLLDGRPVATLEMCRITAGALSDTDVDHAVRYAAVAAVLLQDDAVAGNGAGAVIGQEAAFLLQATGRVMVQADVDADTALHRLRRYAVDHDRHVRDVVVDVLAHRLRFDPSSAS